MDNASKDILIKLIAKFEKDKEAIGFFNDIKKYASSSQKSINDLSKSFGDSNKDINRSAKGAYFLGSAVKAFTSPLMLAIEGLKILTLTGVTFAKTISDAGVELTALSSATGMGNVATQNLRSSYDGLVDSGAKVVTTLKDAAAAMSNFSKQGFAQLQLASQKPMQQFITTLQNTFTQGMGKDAGTQLTQRVTQAFGNNLAALRAFRDQWISAGNDLNKQQDIISKFAWVDRSVMTQAIGSIQTLRDKAAGVADPAVMANLSWQDFGNSLLAIFNQIQQAMAKAFGVGTSGLLEKINEYVNTGIRKVKEWTTIFIKIGAVFKTVWNWFSNSASIAINIVASLWNGLLADMHNGFAYIEKFWDKSSAAITEKTAQLYKNLQDQNFLDIDKSRSDLKSYTTILNESLKEVEDNAKGISTGFDNSTKPLDKLSVRLNQIANSLLPIIQETKNWKDNLDQAAGSLNTTADLVQLVGNNIQINGQYLADMIGGSFVDSIKSAKQLLDESAKGLPLAEEQLKIARDQHKEITKILEDKRNAGATEKEIAEDVNNQQASAQKINKFLDERNQLLSNQLHAHKAIQNAQEQALSQFKANLTLISAEKDLQQANLNISKALYGTPALGVQAIQSVVDLMQQEKEQLIAMLETQKKNVKQMISEGIQGDKLLNARKLELDLQKQIADKTSEQLGMLKELRDGYLNAVQASAFGAGKFEKIIIDQEKNLGIALDKNIAKRNYLLGQVGDDARKSNRQSFRFSDQGMGILQDSSGRSLTPEQMQKYSQDAINNIGDSANRAAAQQGMDAITGIYKGIQGQQIKASTDNTSAVNQNTEAINNLISGKSGALHLGALKGTLSGGVVVGEAIRKMSQSSPMNDPILDGIRKHWESHSKQFLPEGLRSTDTLARRSGGKFVPETRTGKVLSHGKKQGGVATRVVNKVVDGLMDAINGLTRLGPVVDEIVTQDDEINTSPSGLKGETGQFGAP